MGLLEELADALDNGLVLASVGADLCSLCRRESSSSRAAGCRAFESQGQQQRRAGGQDVLSRKELVVAVAFPVLQVVEDLEGDAQVPAELHDHLFVVVGRPGQAQAGVQGRLEGGSRLQGVNLESIQGSQRFLRLSRQSSSAPCPSDSFRCASARRSRMSAAQSPPSSLRSRLTSR